MPKTSFQPEVKKGDALYKEIVETVKKFKPKTILEIGSANGLGSTQAFLEAGQELDRHPAMVCLEADSDRFAELLNNIAEFGWVTAILAATTTPSGYIDEFEIDELFDFANSYECPVSMPIGMYSEDTVRGWRMEELDKIVSSGIPQNGIERAKSILGNDIDMVFMDGSAFTGMAELYLIRGARVIILDDVCDIKNWRVFECLTKPGSGYRQVSCKHDYRNGFAVFVRNDDQ